ncbi:TOMM precursor leader peptide-binding protein [Actinomadura rudentiformis]|uniref:TOMM precursor leader peptide-binding protein n=1 Tax=Actinomadura rudentiformis TaxID=359158 RepID=UPI00178C2B9E|nr:TOMM precursor leader peptide-binding protein [Actinomadura rudentiformis]
MATATVPRNVQKTVDAISSREQDRARVERFLDERVTLAGGEIRPQVAVLGAFDVFDGDRNRADTRSYPVSYPVHLTQSAVLFGPSASEPAAGSPCPECLARRWQRLQSTEEREALESGRAVHAVAGSPYLTSDALEMMWHLYARLATARPPVSERLPFVHELRLDSLGVRRFRLMADPDCPSCGRSRPGDREAARLDFVDRAKRAPDSYHLRAATDVPLPLDALINPICGVLGRSAHYDVTSPTTAPVNGQMKLRIAERLFDVHWSGHADSYDESLACGVFEGLERYAGGQRRGLDHVVVDSYDRLGSDALDPRECGLYDDEVYRSDPDFTAFAPDRPISWVWGYSLRDERPVLVPERISYYMERRVGDGDFVHECSNGCAGGGCVEEAVLFGMLELIERDAFLLAWYGKARLPEILPESVGDPAARIMMDRMRMHGYDVRLFDNRVDLPVPVVTAVARRRDGGLGTLCFAAGAGLDPAGAVRAALCEIASYIPSLPERVNRLRDELAGMAVDFAKVSHLTHHAALFGLPEMERHARFFLAERTGQAMTDLYREWERFRPQTLNLLDDLRFCRDLLIGAGFDVIVVEQTCPEQAAAGLRNVCVIVPGLLPIDFGWHKQRALHMPRMRTAFRRAGWRSTDLEEGDLHRVPHPFP